jgi:DNA-binding response OmpR family regulator
MTVSRSDRIGWQKEAGRVSDVPLFHAQVRITGGRMKTLIVEGTEPLARLWQRHLQRNGIDARIALSEDQAVAQIDEGRFDVIVLDLVLEQGSALAVADYARFRSPDTSVIFVTDTTFFSDGSIFSLMPNARAFMPSATPPEDLAAMVEHYGRAVA